jgi:hypothetical protein
MIAQAFPLALYGLSATLEQNSMNGSPSWEPNSGLASEEIQGPLWNSKA